jgi:hypothetical protein
MLPFAIVAGLALAAGSARAGSAGNAAPLGVEIGVATYDQVKGRVGDSTELADGGLNKFTGGKTVSGNGEGLGVAGLKHLTFVFDREGVLQGVFFTMEKNFRPTYEMLKKKYNLVSQRIPFVGDSNARFSQGQSVIILDAPHLSFEMTLSYVSRSFLASYQARSAEDKVRREREQEDRL